MTSRSRTYNATTAVPVRKYRATAGLRVRAGAAASFLLLFLFAFIFSSSQTFAVTPPKTIISNTAEVFFTDGPASPLFSTPSNSANIMVIPARTPATVELLQYAPLSPQAEQVKISPTEYQQGSGAYAGLNPPVPAGSTTPIDLSNPVPLAPAAQYHAGEPVFVRLTDLDQNWDPDVIETVLVTLVDNKTGDTEVLRLMETGPNTGIFTGYIQSTGATSAGGNGSLSVNEDSLISAHYVDVQDGTTADDEALVDPFGVLFNTANGEPLNGFTVKLINVATGLPATVFGDDAVSSYPATVTSGGTATDAGGAAYNFPPGGYRFPFIAPGQYRLVVSQQEGFRIPSTVDLSAIQMLPNAPFTVVEPGSRGETFPVNAGPAIRIDIPVDQVTGRLFIIKTTSKGSASQGEFIPYSLTVENIDATYPVLDVMVQDKLPHAFRYRRGSVKINGVPVADPVISEDGRTLQFPAGRLEIGAKAVITYVAEIGTGAEAGKALNSVYAFDTVTRSISNTATAVVIVKHAFFDKFSTIVGKVFVDGCGDPEKSEEGGLPGVRLYLENGTSVVTDAQGMYHFEGVNSGAHVVQLDEDSMPIKYEPLQCEENTRFAGNGNSQFVDLQGGALWRADFHLGLKPRGMGQVGIELRSRLKKGEYSEGDDIEKRRDTLQFLVPVYVGEVPARNIRITVIMPDGSVYIPGTSTLNAVPIDDPEVMETAVTFRIQDAPADWESSLRFDAEIPLAGTSGNLGAKAILTVDTPNGKNVRTPLVDNMIVRHTTVNHQQIPDIVLHPKFSSGSDVLTSKDKKDLDKLMKDLVKVNVKSIKLVGHTDSQRISGRLKKIFADNYVLSHARAASVGGYIAAKLKLKPEQMSYDGKGPDEPVASNATKAGMAKNRRVEMIVETIRTVTSAELRTVNDMSGMKAVATIGFYPGETWPGESAANVLRGSGRNKMPDYDSAWVESAKPGFEWLWPVESYNPSIPSIKAAVKHDPAKKLVLLLNGNEVDGLYLDGTITSRDQITAVTDWMGIHIQDGDNLFEAVQYDEQGAETDRVKRTIHYSTSPVKVELVPTRSVLVANGKTPPVVAVRLTDKDGYLAREGLVGEFMIEAPHQIFERNIDPTKNVLTKVGNDRLKYQVGADGIALIELQPTSQSGDAVLRFNLVSGSEEIRAWLKPESRDWILVGLADGTAGYRIANGNMESLADSGEQEKLYQDGRLAFYAKGKIKGEWLLTMAYDSEKNGRNEHSLYQTIDPNQYYLLYGDATQQRHDAPSAKSLYIRMERNQFYALFGDFGTNMSTTELTRYNRSFTGLKSEMKTENYEYSAFMSETNQAYVRDEIRGDGTSGLYRLTRKNIVINSESVTLETRDRFQSQNILSAVPMNRFADYSIDYDSGTLWFKTPVYSRDADLNPVYIVVQYESYDATDISYNYGGRGAVRLLANKVEAGASVVHENRVGGGADLEGVDVSYKIDDKTKLRVEAATTQTDLTGGSTSGSAYLAEIQHRSDNIEGKVYVREQDGGFGLGQQNAGESGTRKTGLELAYRVNKPWTLNTEAFRQENISDGGIRDMAQFRGQYAVGKYSAFSGLRHAEDQLSTGEVLRSGQMFAGGNYQFTDRLTGRTQYDQSLIENESADFPTRLLTGLDYRLGNTASLFADQERTWGAFEDTATTRIGLRATPWTGGDLNSTVQQQTTEYGPRVFATTGLRQTWQVNKSWSADAGVDRSSTIRHPGNDPFNEGVAPASGGGSDFTAVSVGAGFHEDKWSWTGRTEGRWAQDETKYTILTGANGEPRTGIGMAAGLQAFIDRWTSGAESTGSDLRLALAYRPVITKWIILDRFDYFIEKKRGEDTDINNDRFVNNLSLNWKKDDRTQISFLQGAKYVRETIDSADYSSYIFLGGTEGRYDLTKQWDVGARVLALYSLSAGQVKYGTGVSVGYTFYKNIWASVGINFDGFRDNDFSLVDFTSAGFYLKLRMKFDQTSARSAVKWISGQ